MKYIVMLHDLMRDVCREVKKFDDMSDITKYISEKCDADHTVTIRLNTEE